MLGLEYRTYIPLSNVSENAGGEGLTDGVVVLLVVMDGLLVAVDDEVGWRVILADNEGLLVGTLERLGVREDVMVGVWDGTLDADTQAICCVLEFVAK
jgi:hypothetical protein